MLEVVVTRGGGMELAEVKVTFAVVYFLNVFWIWDAGATSD